MPLTPAQLCWTPAGVPYSAQFDDIYFSQAADLAETTAVFLQPNQLPQRWLNPTDNRPFVLAELGFGSGLNFLASWASWQHSQARQPLHYIALEKHPLIRSDLQAVLQHWDCLQAFATPLIAQYPPLIAGCHRLQFAEGQVCLDLWLGDVLDVLPQLASHAEGLVDAWYLDGFAPSKNPTMWTTTVFKQLARFSRSEATFSTFTAAGQVRRDLMAAGFTVEKIAGFAHKREMLRGYLAKPNTTGDAETAPWLRLPNATQLSI